MDRLPISEAILTLNWVIIVQLIWYVLNYALILGL